MAFCLSLPQPLFDEPLASILLARDGTLLSAKIAPDGQWRFPPATHVPEKYRHAVLAFEDKRFESHIGIDPLAIARAARLNVKNGKTVSGASTITMQVARLARAGGSNGEGADRTQRRSYGKKLAEMALALRIEAAYSKDQILALYAGHAPFGGNVVGLEAASWRYFGRAADRLSWAEAATLAVLPNAPALVTPGRSRTVLLRKRDKLLRRMRDDGVITQLELDLALAERLVDAPVPLPNHARHLLETLRSRNPGMHRFETTLDAGLQIEAARMVEEKAKLLAGQGVHNAAALVVDNRTFEVLAYVGNARWSTRNDHGLAVDVIRRPRSTGSILKPVLYAAMLDSGQLLPHMLVPDIPTQYSGYMPENFDRAFRGAVPADVALAQSLNVPAVRSLQEYGVERFHDLLRGMGMSTLTRRPDDYGLTLILGGAEGTLWDITGLYANLAELARQITPAPPSSYRSLNVVAPVARSTESVVSEITPAAAWLTLNALLEAPRPADEAQWMKFASSRKIAWKTGTSWGFRDAWSVGSTSRYTVGVWVGNATGEGRAGLTGATAAAPLMFELHGRLTPSPWFTQPTLSMKQVAVCRDDGFLANDHCERALEWTPAASHFDRQSPYHRLVHLDAAGQHRVDSSCEPVSRMRHESWLVLPPAQEYYFRRSHAGYRELPPFRADCVAAIAARDDRPPMDFLYPGTSGATPSAVYIPVELDGQKSRTIVEAVHREPGASLYWHLDGAYVGSTETFHQLSLDLPAGHHVVTIVDSRGNRIARTVEVLSAEATRR
jgi:penicillin-binding protein 1C